MNPVPEQKRLQFFASFLPIAIFFVLLWMPLADSFLGLDKAPVPNEKRLMAKFPAFVPSASGVRDFLSGLDAYYNDHFGFRKRLIRWEHKWKHDFFRESSVSDVIIGRDGWLFYASGGDVIGQCRGLAAFSDEELKTWQALLEHRRDWLAKRGIKYLFVIAPNKQTVYPEFLPEWLIKTGPYDQLEQFFQHMKAHSTLDVLDLRPAMLEAKKTAPIYLCTDIHWNALGGFAGYQALIRALARQLPDLGEPLPLAAFDQQFTSHGGGDVAELMGQEHSIQEKNYVKLCPRPPLLPIEVKVDDAILPKQWGVNRHPVYTHNQTQKRRILFFRDSFSNGWNEYVGYHFCRAAYVWQYEWDTALIEREKPDIVVDEMLERFLYSTDPKKLMKADATR